MIVRLIAIFVIVADLTLIPSEDDGETDASCTNILRPFEFEAEYLFLEFGKKKLIKSPFFSPGMVEYFNGTVS